MWTSTSSIGTALVLCCAAAAAFGMDYYVRKKKRTTVAQPVQPAQPEARDSVVASAWPSSALLQLRALPWDLQQSSCQQAVIVPRIPVIAGTCEFRTATLANPQAKTTLQQSFSPLLAKLQPLDYQLITLPTPTADAAADKLWSGTSLDSWPWPNLLIELVKLGLKGDQQEATDTVSSLPAPAGGRVTGIRSGVRGAGKSFRKPAGAVQQDKFADKVKSGPNLGSKDSRGLKDNKTAKFGLNDAKKTATEPADTPVVGDLANLNVDDPATKRNHQDPAGVVQKDKVTDNVQRGFDNFDDDPEEVHITEAYVRALKHERQELLKAANNCKDEAEQPHMLVEVTCMLQRCHDAEISAKWVCKVQRRLLAVGPARRALQSALSRQPCSYEELETALSACKICRCLLPDDLLQAAKAKLQQLRQQQFAVSDVAAWRLQNWRGTLHPIYWYSPKRTILVQGVRYTKLCRIGEGGSSEVYKVLGPDSKFYALKLVNLAGKSASAASSFLYERNLLMKLKDKQNIVKLVGSEVQGGVLHMVLELGTADLACLLANPGNAAAHGRPQQKDESLIRSLWRQMLHAVADAHNQHILHRDIKPANFVLVERELKLIDFGIARKLRMDGKATSTVVAGTPAYMAPEALKIVRRNSQGLPVTQVDRPSDVWSLGCSLYQMVYGRTPFGHLTGKALVRAIRQHKVDYPALGTPALLDVMKRCLDKNPVSRITVQELLAHQFLHPSNQPAPSVQGGTPECLFQELIRWQLLVRQALRQCCHQSQLLHEVTCGVLENITRGQQQYYSVTVRGLLQFE